MNILRIKMKVNDSKFPIEFELEGEPDELGPICTGVFKQLVPILELMAQSQLRTEVVND